MRCLLVNDVYVAGVNNQPRGLVKTGFASLLLLTPFAYANVFPDVNDLVS